MAPEKTMILTDQIHKLQDKIRTPFELRTFSLPNKGAQGSLAECVTERRLVSPAKVCNFFLEPCMFWLRMLI
jgi:hypothetical protein